MTVISYQLSVISYQLLFFPTPSSPPSPPTPSSPSSPPQILCSPTTPNTSCIANG
ncbi:hypothetical protein [Anabaena azotica]|uniref:hypothetical protein n=1 Tax=Anabaena azotica TaxID=197653 RepID=UPI0016879F88|nr:hypothetical protein [Anabaena azotica]